MMIYMIAGEVSGDLLGGSLIAALKKKGHALQILGTGGPCMQREGLTPILPFEDLSVMGFTDVLKKLPTLVGHFYTLANKIHQDNPEAVVLIDYPGMNLRLAKKLRKLGYSGKIIQYVSPSVWAWGKKRIQTMAKTLDLLLTLFPFEPAYFSHTTLKTVFTGHPLAKKLAETPYDPTWRKKYGIPENKPLLALFPGSRPQEIERHLPLFLKTASLFLKKNPGFTVVTCAATKVSGFVIDPEDRYHLMRDAKLALAKSGTVTLELALLGCPTVMAYKLTAINYFLARFVFHIQLPFYSLPNLLLQRPLIPEWIGYKICPHTLVESLQNTLQTFPEFASSATQLHALLTNTPTDAATEISRCLGLKQ